MAKVMISLPDELLERIDRAADRDRLSRSGFLQDAARRVLGEARGDERQEAAESLIGLAADLPGPSAAEAVRSARDRLDVRDRARARR